MQSSQVAACLPTIQQLLDRPLHLLSHGGRIPGLGVVPDDTESPEQTEFAAFPVLFQKPDVLLGHLVVLIHKNFQLLKEEVPKQKHPIIVIVPYLVFRLTVSKMLERYFN